MDEFVCVTLVGRPGESEPAFKGRLVAFWSHVLRTRPDDYDTVYAEARAFEAEGGRAARRYMVAPAGVPAVVAEAAAAGVDALPPDVDDLYSKAEASSSEWFQID